MPFPDGSRGRAEIVDIPDICKSFPQVSGTQIERDNVLQLLDTMLDGELQLLTIEGTEGIGKTTLLAQFAKGHRNRCFSVFVRPTSRFAYDPTILLLDVCDQMNWLLHAKELPIQGAVDEAKYRQLLLELQRRARQQRTNFYFVVDGLSDLPSDGPQAQDILAMLPIGLPQFRFLISGTAESLLERFKSKIIHKSVPIPGFTLDETVRFFSDSQMSTEIAHEFHRASKGVPSHLATIRRLLEGGSTPESLVNRLPGSLANLFDLEWKAVDDSNELQVELLAILAHERRKYTVARLAALFETDVQKVRDVLSPLTFVKIQVVDNDHEYVEFVSGLVRTYAATRLNDWRERVRARLMNSLLQQPESEEALTYLPTYLEEAGRLEDLLEFLSPDHLTAMIKASQSLTPVQQKTDLGLTAALRLDRDGDTLRFGLERTVITELASAGISRAEIEARTALGEYEASIALAQNAVLKEERLRLLAAIGRFRKERGLSLEPELLEQINQLFDTVDNASLESNRLELASDLMYSKPDLAIQLAERGQGHTTTRQGSDWTLAQLSLIATASTAVAQTGLSQTAEEIRQRIKDPEALEFSRTISLLFGDYRPEELLREANKLSTPQEQLFLLRNWAEQTKQSENSGDVIEYALRLAIRTTEYTPVATDLRQLATPLPYLKDSIQLRSLVGTFDTQKATIERLGPTEDYIRLQLQLAHAETRYDLQLASLRLLDTYYYISDIPDLELRTACTARLVAALPQIDPSSQLSDTKEIVQISSAELEERVSTLLASTADHYLASRNVISALAKNKPQLARNVVKALNTEPRRDAALFDLVKQTLKQRTNAIPLNCLNECIDDFADPDLKDEALFKIQERMARSSEEALGAIADSLVPLIGRIHNMGDPNQQALACCYALISLSKSGKSAPDEIRVHIQRTLSEAWSRMEISNRKVNSGFRIAAIIAPYSRDLAQEYLSSADALRKAEGLADSGASHIACIRLAIRAYSGLLPRHFDTSEDLGELTRQIERVVSERNRLILWTDLALKLAEAGRSDQMRAIVGDRVKPQLEAIRAKNPWAWQKAISDCCPVLYENHKSSTLDTIGQLHPEKRNEAYDNLVSFILRKVWRFEPYAAKSSGYRFPLSYENAVDICEILDKMEEDVSIYGPIECIVESILWKPNRTNFSQQQKADLRQRLTNIINGHLPNPRLIAHEGFKILAQAQVNRLTRFNSENWNQIVSTARTIPNVSDRGYVLANIARSDSGADFGDRLALLKEARALVDQVPSVLDRASRYQDLAEASAGLDAVFCKQCIRNAFGLIPHNHNMDSETESLQREIVDLAHQVDPGWAPTIAASLDDDEARAEVRNRLALQDLKKTITDKAGEELTEPVENDALNEVAWSMLGQLNANRIQPLPVKQTRRYLKIAAGQAISDAFPLLSWIVGNAVSRRAQSNDSRRLLKSIFEAVLVGCELSFRLGGRTANRLAKAIDAHSAGLGRNTVIIHSGERERGLEYLGEWLRSACTGYLKICDPYFGVEDLAAC